MTTIDPLPPAYSVYSLENVDNFGRPLRGDLKMFSVHTDG